MSIIRTEHLTKTFGDLAAVVDLDLEVAEGEIFGLVGPDGAGKTTTMRLLTAIMDPTSGDAWVAGRHVVREAEADQGRHRLHEPAFRPLPRPDRDGEPRLLRRHLQRARGKAGRRRPSGCWPSATWRRFDAAWRAISPAA